MKAVVDSRDLTVPTVLTLPTVLAFPAFLAL